MLSVVTIFYKYSVYAHTDGRISTERRFIGVRKGHKKEGEKRMKHRMKKVLALTICAAMTATLLPLSAAAEDTTTTFWDLNNTENVQTEEMTVTVDGTTVNLTRYWGHYYDEDEPNQIFFGPGMYGSSGLRDDLQINIFVPDGATENSAVLFILNNSSWGHNEFPGSATEGRNGLPTISDGDEFTAEANDKIGEALSRNMVVVSYGARCRGSVNAVECTDDTEGAVELGDTGTYYVQGDTYVGHSPATVVDTKAAIRYLKYNIEQGNIPADENKIIVAGHSGGGALASIIGATGNAEDFNQYLENAAPATDDVGIVYASAPITDLPMADQAYEFTFSDYRDDAPYGDGGNSAGYLSYADPSTVDGLMDLSATLSSQYETYIQNLFGEDATAYRDDMTEMLKESVQHEIDLDAQYQYAGADGVDLRPADDTRGWFTLDEDGNVESFNLDTYETWLVQHVNLGDNQTRYSGNELKGVMAFMSQGITNGYTRNENNLYGTSGQPYGIAYSDLWDRVADKSELLADLDSSSSEYAAISTYSDYWNTYGDTLSMEMKMNSPIPYLMGSDNMWYLSDNQTSDESTVAPNWFIRHGMCDVDTSIAMVVELTKSVEENLGDSGNVNAYFGWERNHNGGGNTYYGEFFQWLDDSGITTVELPFTDVPDDAWYADDVQYVYEKGYMVGTEETTFSPYDITTRAQAMQVLYKMSGDDAVEYTNSYTDVQSGKWYTDAIAWATANGIASGYADGTFGPNDTVTREQLASFLYRYATYKGYDVSATSDLSSYTDASSIASYARTPMAWCNQAGIISGFGDGTLGPKSGTTRAQLASMLMRFDEAF